MGLKEETICLKDGGTWRQEPPKSRLFLVPDVERVGEVSAGLCRCPCSLGKSRILPGSRYGGLGLGDDDLLSAPHKSQPRPTTHAQPRTSLHPSRQSPHP